MPTLTMLVGVSYSGKSTIAEKIARISDAVIVSSDAIRGEIYGDENCQANHAKVFEIVHRRIRTFLKEGRDVVYDATSLSCKRRMSFLRTLSDLDVTKHCVVVIATWEDIKKRMLVRERVVPEEVVHRQICQFQCPNYYEGWDNIDIIWTSKPNECLNSMKALYNETDMPHDNSHHSLSVRNHMKAAAKAAEQCRAATNDDVWVAEIHDIGKPRTKTLFDKEGKPTQEAHYYNHQNYGAYYSLIFNGANSDVSIQEALDMACLIQWHMEHYFRKKDALEKFYAMLGPELTTRLHILEEADRQAH